MRRPKDMDAAEQQRCSELARTGVAVPASKPASSLYCRYMQHMLAMQQAVHSRSACFSALQYPYCLSTRACLLTDGLPSLLQAAPGQASPRRSCLPTATASSAPAASATLQARWRVCSPRQAWTAGWCCGCCQRAAGDQHAAGNSSGDQCKPTLACATGRRQQSVRCQGSWQCQVAVDSAQPRERTGTSSRKLWLP